MKLENLKRVFFIGIGGIGMSAQARFFNDLKIEVFGYDKTESTLTKKLVEEGMKIHYDDDISNIPDDVDLVIYTPAIPKDHKQLNFVLDNNYKVLKRAEVLGMLSKDCYTIAIAGTHGKTSTSAITAHLLNHGKLNISAFVGGIMKEIDSNYIGNGNSAIVLEADEYDRSFLHLRPDIAVILSMDSDHLDIYGNEDFMIEGFLMFIRNLKKDGTLLLKKGLEVFLDEQTQGYLKENNITLELFGADSQTNRIVDTKVTDGQYQFSFENEALSLTDLKIELPGLHNAMNASAAIMIAHKMGLEEELIRKGLESFKGIKRRFDIRLKSEGVVYIDDYAHHPTEIEAAYKTARELFPGKHITVVFQPHLYSRTRDFAEGFAKSLDGFDRIWLMEIYPAREKKIKNVDSNMILNLMTNKNKALVQKAELIDKLKKQEIEVLMTLGAGDIDVFVAQIEERLKEWL